MSRDRDIVFELDASPFEDGFGLREALTNVVGPRRAGGRVARGDCDGEQ